MEEIQLKKVKQIESRIIILKRVLNHLALQINCEIDTNKKAKYLNERRKVNFKIFELEARKREIICFINADRARNKILA